MTRPPRTLRAVELTLLDRLSRRLDGGYVPGDVRRAVDVLTAAADPSRADRLAVGSREPAVLVERLAAWALRRTTDEAVADAIRILDGPGDLPQEASVEDVSAADRAPLVV